ncbi:hypothetical protein [Parapedobacter sp. DT-150]|uniref:hypothetical protein n=1 Tax=Parapedobacter sp. DT-150 TaxID=3396162 RepID=UPI003F1D2260
MKYISFVVLMLLSTACSKTSSPCAEGDPRTYYIHFELDSSYPSDVQVEISNQVKIVDILKKETWETDNVSFTPLAIDQAASDITGKRLLGPFPFAMGWEPCDVKEDRRLRDEYYLLRFNSSETVSLRFRDSSDFNPTVRKFHFYLNEKELEVTDDLKDIESIGFVTISKSHND